MLDTLYLQQEEHLNPLFYFSEMKKEYIEPPEMSFTDVSDIESILDLSEKGQNMTVTTSFSEPFVTSAVLEHQRDNQGSEALSGLTPLTPVKHICPKCGANILKKNFTRHYKSHFDIKYQCKECSKYFQSQRTMDLHNKKRHSRKEICPYCGRFYKQRSALNEHIRIKHEKSAKMMTCKICDKQFPRAGHLQSHMNTHYGITPYSCQKCGRVYRSTDSLKRHAKKCSGLKRHAKKCSGSAAL